MRRCARCVMPRRSNSNCTSRTPRSGSVATACTAGAYPSPEYSCVADAVRDLAENNLNVCALVGGEIELLEGVCFSLADIGDVLGCSVLPFDCSSLSDGNEIPPSDLLQEPSFAVAFGLALRDIAQ